MLRADLRALLLVMALLGGCGGEQENHTSAMAGARLSGFLGASGAQDYARAEHQRSFVFPQDHAAHDAFRTEWWYLTAVLRNEQQADFGVQFTLFRQRLSPPGENDETERPWHSRQAFMGHLAVTDVAEARHEHGQRLARGHPSLAGVAWVDDQPGQTVRAYIEDWSLTISDEQGGDFILRGAIDQSAAVELRFKPQCSVVLQGDQGLSRKGPSGASYYYSMPRLQAEGWLELDGQRHQVAGLAWLDREWSTSVLGEHLTGWNWFALQLDDGRSVMAFKLSRKDGAADPYDHGVIVSDCGTRQHQRMLHAEDYALTPTRFWTDSHGNAWPIDWSLMLDGELMHIQAMVDDQLMDDGLRYWEGVVAVRDAQQRQLGRGYMELTGYGSEGDE